MEHPENLDMLPELDTPSLTTQQNFVDSHEVLVDLTPEEEEEGERLRQNIDVDDDEDNGVGGNAE